MIHIVLVQPEIPQNTGNIARTCAATGCDLHLVEPLGFKLEDKYLKRAGLDYWPMVHLTVHRSFEEVQEILWGIPFYFTSVRGAVNYSEVTYEEDVALVFGRESCGLPENLLKDHYDHCIRIPMIDEARSLNLSNSVAIVTYEVLRQKNFSHLRSMGSLTGDCHLKNWKDYV